MLRRSRFSACLLLALSTAASGALANGRFPRAQQLIEDPKDPQHLILRSTYGILVTRDGAQTWSWICEQAVGYTGIEDPSLGLTGNGTLLAGIFDGLRASPDAACEWSFPEPELEGRFVVDLTVLPTNRDHVYALTSNGLGKTFDTRLYKSIDAGVTWSLVGQPLPDDLLGLTLDPAPSDEARIYVSGLGQGSVGLLLRSDDGGESWQRRTLERGGGSGGSPFIAAVHPTDPDTLYVRTTGEVNTLWVSQDAGKSFEGILRKTGRMLGFALSGDGNTVFAGFGDPKEGAIPNPDSLGLWRASTSDYDFSHVYQGPINCLTWTERGLYACGSQFDQGFELALAKDPLFAPGATDPFEPLLTLTGLDGPVSCSAGSAGAQCEAFWPDTCATIGKCTGEPEPEPPQPNADPVEDDGCGCRVAGASGWSLSALGLCLFLVLAARRRLRR